MAFTGTPTIKQTADNIVRITGLSLAAGAVGTIGLFGATGTPPDVVLPRAFKTEHYTYDDAVVQLADGLHVTVGLADNAAGGGGGNIQLAPIKTGTTVPTFRTTITNPGGSVSGGLEIWFKYHT
jgi:hypothetical protein